MVSGILSSIFGRIMSNMGKTDNKGWFGNLLSGIFSQADSLGSGALSSYALGQVNGSLNRKFQNYARYADFADWAKKFNIQNEYNSPLQQVQRLREAGLHPGLMYGGAGGSLSAQVASHNTSVPGVYSDPMMLVSMENQTKVADAEANKLNAEAEELRRHTKEGNATFDTRFEQLKDQAEVDDYARQIASVNANFAQSTAEEQLDILKSNATIAEETAKNAQLEYNKNFDLHNLYVRIKIGGESHEVTAAAALPLMQIMSVQGQLAEIEGQVRHWQNQDVMEQYRINYGTWFEQNQARLQEYGFNIEAFKANNQLANWQTLNQQFERQFKFAQVQYKNERNDVTFKRFMDIGEMWMSFCSMGLYAYSSAQPQTIITYRGK